MEHTERDRLLKRLAAWRGPGGILSAYVDVDRADRGQAWRIALRDRLHELAKASAPRHSAGMRVAAGRILEHFPEDGTPPDGRAHAGFVEVAARPTEMWRAMQVPVGHTEVVHAQRPYLRPLVELFERWPDVGAVLVSAERVRLLDWSLGSLRELGDWEITLWSRDWRERKAQRPQPGAGVGMISASGRDQFDQRLEANRQRFLRELGQRVGAELGSREWRHLIAFGAEPHAEQLAHGLDPVAQQKLHVVPQDLISATEADLAGRVEAEVRKLGRAREAALIREVDEAIGTSPGAALGPQETLEALAEGRVRHLVVDAGRDFPLPSPTELLTRDGEAEDGVPVAERMIRLAVTTGAQITCIGDEAAAALEAHDGVAGLLRY
jgi:Bacterial archaeo-eukaryotic release factor family 5